MINKQVAIGNLASDAKITSVAGNRNCVHFRVLSNYRYYSTSKEAEVVLTEGFNVEVFVTDRQVDYFKRHFVKGALVYFEGRTQTDDYIDASDIKRYNSVIKCRDVDDVKLVAQAPNRTEQRTPAQDGARQDTPTRSNPAAPSDNRSHEAPTARTDLMDFDKTGP